LYFLFIITLSIMTTTGSFSFWARCNL